MRYTASAGWWWEEQGNTSCGNGVLQEQTTVPCHLSQSLLKLCESHSKSPRAQTGTLLKSAPMCNGELTEIIRNKSNTTKDPTIALPKPAISVLGLQMLSP